MANRISLLTLTCAVVVSGLLCPVSPVNGASQVEKPWGEISVLPTTLALTESDVATAKSSDDLVDMVGVDTHLGFGDTPYYGSFDSVILPKLRELSIRHIRDGLGNPNGKVRAMTYGNMLEEVHRLGIDFTLVAGPNSSSTLSNDVQWAGELAPAIRIIEGTNESDEYRTTRFYEGLAFPKAEVKWEADLVAAMRGNGTTAHIPLATGSMAFSSDYSKICDVTECPETQFDFGNMHSYAGANPPSGGLDANIKNTRLAVGSKPVIATETGYHTDTIAGGFPGISELAAAKYLSRLPFEYYNRGVYAVDIYELIDDLPDPNQKDIQDHFGLLRNDGTEKPAFTALSRIMKRLNDKGPAFDLPQVGYKITCPVENDAEHACTSNLHSTLLAKRNGRLELALWLEVPSYDTANHADLIVEPITVAVNLAKSYSKVEIFNPLVSSDGVGAAFKTSNFVVKVPDSVVIVELIP